jgi:SAM-dependent methyltransferase
MIPFQLHRRIPLVRRPFFQRDQAIEQRDGLARERDRALAERDALALKLSELSLQPANRTRDLKRVYVEHVARMAAAAPREVALEAAVGGHFDVIGRIEVAILRHYGLKQDDSVIDVGCGSGRLAKPLSAYLRGRYSGFDVVDDLVEHARAVVQRPDWRFEAIDHIGIPEPDGSADMVCFFSVFTHLLHEQSYWYLQEAIRVLKPGGKILFSFLEFREPAHWAVFTGTLAQAKAMMNTPLNVFLSREAILVWAEDLGLQIEEIRDAAAAVSPDGALGQTLCVLRKSPVL